MKDVSLSRLSYGSQPYCENRFTAHPAISPSIHPNHPVFHPGTSPSNPPNHPPIPIILAFRHFGIFLRGYALDSTTPKMLWFFKIKMVHRELHEFDGSQANCLLLSHAHV